MNKKTWREVRFLIVHAIWVIIGCMLYQFEYLANFNEIDNIVGIIPVALMLVVAIGVSVLMYMKHSKQSIPVTITMTLLVILSAVLFPTALRGNWWINPTTVKEAQTSLDLTLYAPFTGSETVTLDETSTLQLTDQLPKLDGATALYPIYAAFAQAFYHEQFFSPEYVVCTNTRNAYEAITLGETDIIFVAGPSQQQLAAAKEAGADLHFTPIGHEAFVFLVGKDNPIDNITYQQIRNIYSGKTAYWQTIGWKDGGKIIAFQRPEGSGSQTALQGIMTKLPMQVPQPLPDPSLLGTKSLMKQVSVEWQGVQPAIGYSYRYYATKMYANPDTKLLQVNGVYPSIENIQNMNYLFVADFYAVTNGEPKGNTKRLIDWILSSQGQEIIEKTGYTPLRP